MSFLPHSARGRHAVDEQPLDGERRDDEEPSTGTSGQDPTPPVDGQRPERPRYAFGYAPDDAGDDEHAGGNVVRGDVVREDGDVDNPPVTVSDVPGSADPAPTAEVWATPAPTEEVPAVPPPTEEVPVMDADPGAGTTDSPIPAPQAETEYEPAAQEPVATGAGLEGPLLADAAGLRARWQRAQSDFVDDPRAAVTDAAALVEQTARAMIDALEQRQRQLRQQWERGRAGDPNAPAGEPSDTERLRLTMHRYRALFEQLCGQ